MKNLVIALTKLSLGISLIGSQAGCFHSNHDSNGQVQLAPIESSEEFKRYLTQPYLTLPEQQNIRYEDDVTFAQETAVADSSTDHVASFSGTNLQEQGVDEADIWKYDGENFYILQPASWGYTSNLTALCADEKSCDPEWVQTPASIRIVKNDQQTLSTIDLGDQSGTELYLNDDQLIMVNKGASYYGFMDAMIEPYYGYADSKARIRNWDTSDKQAPVDLNDIELDGYIQRTRRIGDELYIVSRFTPRIEGLSGYPRSQDDIDNNQSILSSISTSDLLPKIRINGEEQALVEASNCLAVQVPTNHWYSQSITTITRFNTKTNTFNSRCLSGPVDGIYMSEANLYLYSNSYYEFQTQGDTDLLEWNQGNSHIHQFSLSTGGFDYQGSALLPGVSSYEDANFRYGELQQGQLAVVTSNTDWQNPKHYLTVLKSDGNQLKQISQLPNAQRPQAIGKPGERIYSVRFMQNRAYIVTFQKVDPLYSIDLSNPDDPKIAGELEIPGFSDYLHPVGDDLLIGVGKGAITGESGTTWYQGIKVALFNVADVANPIELNVIDIGKRGSHTALAYDHHAFTGLDVDGIFRFAFPISVNDGEARGDYWRDPESQFYEWRHSGLHLFEIENNQLINSGAIITDTNEGDQTWDYWKTRRGLIQGDDVYHLSGKDIYNAQWSTPENVSDPF